jgi:hypothetical protein
MAIISPSKVLDLELLTEYSEIVEITYRAYKRNPSPELKQYLEQFIENYQTLKHTIDTKDYTKADESYWRFQALFDTERLSPGADN